MHAYSRCCHALTHLNGHFTGSIWHHSTFRRGEQKALCRKIEPISFSACNRHFYLHQVIWYLPSALHIIKITNRLKAFFQSIQIWSPAPSGGNTQHTHFPVPYVPDLIRPAFSQPRLHQWFLAVPWAMSKFCLPDKSLLKTSLFSHL